MISAEGWKGCCQGRNDNKVAQLQGGQDDAAAGVGQVILVGVADLLGQTVQVQSFEKSRHLRPRAVGQDAAQTGVAKATNVPLAPRQGDEEVEILGLEQVEATIAPLLLANGLTQPLCLGNPGRGASEVGEEGQVAAVGGGQQFPQGSEAVNGLLHGGELGLAGAVPVFHRPVVAKEGDVVHGRLDSQDQALLVVEFDGHWSHVVLEPGALNTSVEVVAQLIPVAASELASEEGGDVVGFDRVDGRANQGVIEGMQVGLAMEDDVGGVLNLHDTPVVRSAELAGDRAVAGGKVVQGPVEALDGEGVGQGLGTGEVRDAAKAVIQLPEGDAGLPELDGQPVMAVAVELEAEGRPGGYPEVAKAELDVDEVEVVVGTSHPCSAG